MLAICLFIVGLIDKVWPVHARSACRWAIIQSNVPFRCTTAKEVMGDLVDMSAVIGLADDICNLLAAGYTGDMNT